MRQAMQDTREVLNGVLWVLGSGAPWHDLPEHYPPYQTCHRRFQGWCATASWVEYSPLLFTIT